MIGSRVGSRSVSNLMCPGVKDPGRRAYTSIACVRDVVKTLCVRTARLVRFLAVLRKPQGTQRPECPGRTFQRLSECQPRSAQAIASAWSLLLWKVGQFGVALARFELSEKSADVRPRPS
jgi:hypothetical protein